MQFHNDDDCRTVSQAATVLRARWCCQYRQSGQRDDSATQGRLHAWDSTRLLSADVTAYPRWDSPAERRQRWNRTTAVGPRQQAVAGRPVTTGQPASCNWWGAPPSATHRSSAVNRTAARVPHERQLATGAHGCNTPNFMRKTATQHGCPAASLRWGCRPERQRRSPRGRCRRPARTGVPLCAIVGVRPATITNQDGDDVAPEQHRRPCSLRAVARPARLSATTNVGLSAGVQSRLRPVISSPDCPPATECPTVRPSTSHRPHHN